MIAVLSQGPAHLHHKANSVGSGHVPVSHAYLELVAMDIIDAKAILIVETLDHPGDGPLLTYAAQSFRAAARMGRPYSPTQS